MLLRLIYALHFLSHTWFVRFFRAFFPTEYQFSSLYTYGVHAAERMHVGTGVGLPSRATDILIFSSLLVRVIMAFFILSRFFFKATQIRYDLETLP